MSPNNACPYPGDVSFHENEGEYFFGRENEIQAIIDKLTSWRLTILYGASGVGKSSVLRAGVAYEVKSRAKENKDLYGNYGWVTLVYPPINQGHLNQDGSDDTNWKNPLQGIKNSLDNIINKISNKQTESLEGKSLSKYIEQVLNCIRDDNGENRLFIILDQIEDYLLRERKLEDAEFERQLVQAMEDRDMNVSFLIAIREDALSKLDHFKYLIPSIFDERF